MSSKIADINFLGSRDDKAKFVATLWTKLNNQRSGIIEEWKESRNFIFATDTSTTSVGESTDHANTVTNPKLTQIRDNLHSNYISSLFPNDDWLKWMSYGTSKEGRNKAEVIEAYMTNKCKENHFRKVMSDLLLDYIDYGNAFAMPSFVASYRELANGETVPNYVGPKAVRISPLDIVFDATASDFESSYKIIRSIKTLGEIAKIAKTEPDNSFWKDVLKRRSEVRKIIGGGMDSHQFNKAVGYQADGFGSMFEYYNGDTVEILEFFGDYYDSESGELYENVILTVADGATVVRIVPMPSWFGSAPIYHVGWRKRTDNLWAMSPLANIIGMQYRIDHLENAKADAIDMAINPPLKVIGEVEEFVWEPNGLIYINEGGDVQEMGKNLNSVITSENQIQNYMLQMERHAGAPSEAMGIRTAGEKTKFEVQSLQNAAGRIFQEKITLFETELLEPLLNSMLETAVRNFSGTDVISVLDTEIGVEQFMTITKADITANGKIRPIGARHFAKQAQDMQNLMGLFNSGIGQMVMPDVSRAGLVKYIEDLMNLKGYEIFSPNAAFFQQQEDARLQAQLQEDLAVEQAVANDPLAQAEMQG